MRPALACALLWALLCGAPAAASAEALDLVGTWYVLVHYKDDHAGNPEQERWDDRVWVFERKGRRLRWTEYPIVVFEDETGRFERRHTGQYARILHSWEPSEAQRADIRSGLQVNSRGSKTKTLRGSDADGWSSSRATSAASASVVTYQEVWSIEGLPSRPVFRRADLMGGGRTDTMEGLTEYAATEASDSRISGTYDRDGSRRGTFRMWRSGEAGAVRGAKDQRELQQKVARREIERALRESPRVREDVARQIDERLQEEGLSLTDAQLTQLADEAVAMFLQEVPQEEIDARLGERIRDMLTRFAPKGAVHDDAVRYGWPFDSEVPRQLLQGVRGDTTDNTHGRVFRYFRRREAMKYAYDFRLPVGTPVVAARAGEVARVVDGHTEGGRQQGMASKTNTVVVKHDDGTFALYLHLSPGIPVEVGQRVERGERLGLSGATGQILEPELLFAVQRLDAEGETRSVPIRFDDGTEGGVLPVMGAYYGGRGGGGDR